MSSTGSAGSSDSISLINGGSSTDATGVRGPADLTAQSESEKVIITFKSQPGNSEQALVRGHGGQVRFTYKIVPAIAATLPSNAIDALRNNPNVERIEADLEITATDAELDNTWGVKKIGAGTVHSGTPANKGAGVAVAVLDSGVNYNHVDLSANFNPANRGWDFVNSDNNPLDDNGHGTHVAGTVAALDNDVATSVVGVAPGARVYALKVLDRRGSGNFSHVIAALDWVIAFNNANDPAQSGTPDIRVTSNSYGSTGDPGVTVQDAFSRAAAAGLLNVVAAGNSGTTDTTANNVTYPGRYASVFCVASVDSTDARATTSGSGPDVDIAAPGVNIYSTSKSGGYEYKSGTSMATPHVAGLAALVFTAFPDATPDQVRSQIQGTAVDLGASGRDNLYGYGRVDAVKSATQAILASVSPANGSYITPSGTGSTSVTVTGTATHVTGNSLSWSWTLDGAPVLDPVDATPVTASTFTRDLSDGSHTVQGTATDSTSGASATVTSTFQVANPPPPPPKALNVTVATDKPSYTNKQKVTITVNVKDENNLAVAGATVQVVILKPNGSSASGTATTNTSGTVTFGYTYSTSGGTGTYNVQANVTKTGYPAGSATTTFIGL